MIPKIIHYCWFGGNPLPELALKCINSWKKNMPDYEIKEWNETNYDVRKIPYIAQAYDAKKYAFVSDYARFDILYQYGGVYFDTDVEVLKDISHIIANGAFIGIEKGEPPLLAAGLGIASPKETSIYKEILDSYANDQFYKADGTYNLKTVVTRVSDIFKEHGFLEKDCLQTIENTTIYPSEYFCPKDCKTGEITFTKNTYTVHHYDASWVEPYYKILNSKISNIYKALGKNFFSKIIILLYAFLYRISKTGIKATIKHYKSKGEK